RIVSVDFANGVNKIIIPQLQQWVPPSQLRGGSWYSAYDSQERILNFDNGSFVELMSYDQDLDKFAGTSRDFIHYDEEPPEDIRTECRARLIDRKGREWFTLTPVEGMLWIFDQIYEPGLAGHPNIDVIEVEMEENPHLDQDEVREFLESLSEEERKVRGSGKFVTRGGLVYKTFNLKTHVINPINPAEYVGPQYRWYMSLDHGFNNPTAVLWHIVDSNNRVITFSEHYESEKTIDYHAQVIKNREATHGRGPDLRVCDPALAQRQALTGTSIQTEYAMRGIGMAFGNNDVLTGVAKVNQYLEIASDGKPNWLITANCANLIKEMQRLRWKTWASKKQQSENNAYDQIHKKDDHACDSARYLFSFLPELKPIAKMPQARVVLPEVGGNSAKSPTIPFIDPNLTPEALGKAKTQWKVKLNDD
ncbi:terminase large subunit domain-containing protein, partial [Streptomyces anandii]|uniref:terminase large subunit domain-containing protein n=1 Tax=Streptomyces anandii TaxID=285454 RepID=UPI0036B4340F